MIKMITVTTIMIIYGYCYLMITI